jgi:catechol 2,3-dioxygenase-like lactoylglutathione lyase family enzyme
MTALPRPLQLRVVLAADDFDAALAFYRDVAGMPERESFEGGDGARVAILDAGAATLEIANAAQVSMIDRVEGAAVPSDHIRLAMEVPDAATATATLLDAGASLLAPPVETPWRSLNARLAAPGPVQLTIFQELGTEPDDWDARVDAVWAADLEDAELTAAIEALVAERDPADAAALYEAASVRDSTGREAEAEPLYRQALAAGLDEHRQPQAVIQLASTIRNLGKADESVALLTELIAQHPDDEWTAPAGGFLALALVSAGQERRAASVALTALASRMTRYSRSLRAYAAEL